MIRVSNLSKTYGFTKAVQDLSFEVEKGEVLGFLGPNGAGKTTTMKILTCFLPPTSGTATVFGFDILEDSMEVRKKIGYLPEKTPLYTDMDVSEYLRFVSNLKGMRPTEIGTAVEKAVENCGLESVYRKNIGTLSKGFQQRVGIAQAIVDDPELLILDEPTIGLDPRQIIDIRRLIKNLGEERTVILSSHILPEVNQVCNRVIIINEGLLVAVDTPDNLRERVRKSSVTKVRIASSEYPADPVEILQGVEGVLRVRQVSSPQGITSYLVESEPEADIRREAAAILVEAGIGLIEIFNEELSLEDIFIKLVTKETE